MSLLKYIWNNKRPHTTPISAAEYKAALVDIDRDKAKAAFEKSWETRNFEIELYWKRANYFWAFIASTFVGYFALASSSSYKTPGKFQHIEVYFLICIGFVLSVAWLLTNIGSKSWQRHWEAHVDLLEDEFTGPLYKIVNTEETFSVSKINEIVSFVFIVIWVLLGVKYFIENDLVRSYGEPYSINWLVVCVTVVAMLAVTAMIFGHSRGRFGHRKIPMYFRKVTYDSSEIGPNQANPADAKKQRG
jgi:hypothetical protein